MSLIFISYVEEDGQLAQEIAQQLEKNHYSPWYYEHDSIPGRRWLDEVSEVIEQCHAMVLVITPRSIHSRQVTVELVQAFEDGKTIVPILSELTHEEFQRAQPRWRLPLGDVVSIRIPAEGIASIMPRIIKGLGGPGPGPAHQAPGLDTIFDDHDQLRPEIFSFPILEVMLRAAKRRNYQNRTRISVVDFIAGLVRKGKFTRSLLQETGVDPDSLYEKIGQHRSQTEENVPGAREEAPFQESQQFLKQDIFKIMDRWIVREKSQFAPLLIELLNQAWRTTLKNSPPTSETKISEQVLLEELIRQDSWASLIPLGLPGAQKVRGLIQGEGDLPDHPETAGFSLDALDDNATSVIHTAHALAKVQGVFPISHRILLSSFLLDQQGVAAKLCRQAGVLPDLVCLSMLASLEERSPVSFDLNREACERAVSPAVEMAVRNVGGGHKVTEADLFYAFCQVADPNFKTWLQQEPLYLDLKRLMELQSPRT